LAEYASIVLICIFTNILFLGGYLDFVSLDIGLDINSDTTLSEAVFIGLSTGLILGLKTCLAIFYIYMS